jgi:hypothetical protein
MSQPIRSRHEKKPIEPYPDVRSAFMLTLVAMLCAALVGIFFIGLGTLAAVGIGQAIGVGAIATLAARRVPEPQAERLGLRALEWRALPTVLCLVPAILLASELDNIAVDWAGQAADRAGHEAVEAQPPLDASAPGLERQAEAAASTPDAGAPEAEDEAEEAQANDEVTSDAIPDESSGPADDSPAPLIDPDDSWSVLQAFVIFAGISPVVEEFLFRGVIQQGLIARLGLLRGMSLVALLWTLLRPAPVDDFVRFFAAAGASFALGWALGLVRVATGSILGSIVLASLWGAVGVGSVALEGRLDLPGLNVPGSHLPWNVAIASAAIVAWAGWSLYREAAERFMREGRDPDLAWSPPSKTSADPDS